MAHKIPHGRGARRQAKGASTPGRKRIPSPEATSKAQAGTSTDKLDPCAQMNFDPQTRKEWLEEVDRTLGGLPDRPPAWWISRWPKVNGTSDPRFWQTVCGHLFEATGLLDLHMRDAQSTSSGDAVAIVMAVERLLRATHTHDANTDRRPRGEEAFRALHSLAVVARVILKLDPMEGDRPESTFAVPGYPTGERYAQLVRLSLPVAKLLGADRLRDAAHFSVTFLPLLLPLEFRQPLTHAEVQAKTDETMSNLERLKTTRSGQLGGHKLIDAEDVIREAGRVYGLSAKKVHDWFKRPLREAKPAGG